MYFDGARRWVFANTSILALAERHPGQSLLLRYEGVVRFPDREIARVLRYAALPDMPRRSLDAAETRDIAAAPHLSNALDPVSGDYIGKGRAGLDPALKRSIARIAAAVQARLGYEPTGRQGSALTAASGGNPVPMPACPAVPIAALPCHGGSGIFLAGGAKLRIAKIG